MLVVIIEILLQSLRCSIGERISEPFRLSNIAILIAGFSNIILPSINQVLRRRQNHSAVVVPGCGRNITVVHQMVQEVDGESSVNLIGILTTSALLDKSLKH